MPETLHWKLVIYPDPRLRDLCSPVPMDTYDEQLAAGLLLDRMWAALSHYNGWGLSAPQIGSPVRAIVVHIKQESGNGCKIEVINPVLTPSKRFGTFMADEGCLSWPGKRKRVKRWRRVKVMGLDRYGESITVGGKDNQAAALQHEIDHLNGINLADLD